ncbi:flavodoxin family protein [Nocardia sp. NPDC003345]
MATLHAVALVCTLKKSPAESSSDRIARQLLGELGEHDVSGEVIRVVDHDVYPGVSGDEGDGDEWPRIRARVREADIVLVSTPTWLGHMSSVAQRTLERLDAELSETDSRGRPSMFGKVALAAVVGNEDGAHKIVADLFQGLNDMGFSLPAQGATYWNGEAMSGVDYLDLDATPKAVVSTNATAARNAAHLARLLRAEQYPPE